MKCGWCEREDHLTQVQVEPPIFRKVKETDPVTGELVLVDVCSRAAVHAFACPDHRAIVFDPSPDVRKIRRRKARGFVQTSIFDDPPQAVPTLHGRPTDQS